MGHVLQARCMALCVHGCLTVVVSPYCAQATFDRPTPFMAFHNTLAAEVAAADVGQVTYEGGRCFVNQTAANT